MAETTASRSAPPLRWGILATGGIAHAFTADLRTAGLDVRAAGSRNAASAQAFAREFEIPRAHDSYEALVADPEVDIVYVSTPHPFHAENAVLALEAGTHVLVEKPFTLDAAGAARVQQAARANGLVAMEAMWTRYLPHMARIRELIAEGALGDVRTVFADHCQSLPTDPTHRLNALELGGGALLDLGIYPISFAWDMLGPAARIAAVGRLADTGADTEASVSIAHSSGAVSTSTMTSRGAGPNTAHIVGTRGRIDIDAVWYGPARFRLTDTAGDLVEEYVPQVAGRGMQFQALAAERVVAGDTAALLLDVDESVAIMRTLDEVRAQLGVVYPDGEAH